MIIATKNPTQREREKNPDRNKETLPPIQRNWYRIKEMNCPPPPRKKMMNEKGKKTINIMAEVERKREDTG